MKGLITDRTQQNVYYRKELSNKGWSGMTSEERAEWLGDPLAVTGANLFPPGPYYSDSVDVKYWSEDILATTKVGGVYIFAPSIVGDAAYFENKVFTLSVDTIESSTTGTPELRAYWHDGNGYEYAGATISSVGSVTFNTRDYPNTEKRAYLALYIYVTTHGEVDAGAVAKFGGVMLENGDVKHPYVPYTDILPTLATKGAYNYSDLNRVERAVAEISDKANLGLVTRTDWKMWDVPTTSEMIRYLYNIEQIRKMISDNTELKTPETMNNFTYREANDIELILSAAYESLKQ